MIFTPRILRVIWSTLRDRGLFALNPDAPSLEIFLAHYAADNADAGIFWPDRTHGLTYLYDVTINQIQVEPTLQPFAYRVYLANPILWNFLPPEFLEANADWAKLWSEEAEVPNLDRLRFILEQGFEVHRNVSAADWTKMWWKAANKSDLKTMRFILEQGFDADTIMQPADWKKLWFAAANYINVEMLKFLLARGSDVNAIDDNALSALDYAAVGYGGSYETVKFLVEAGINLGSVEEIIASGSKNVSSAGEATEQTKIAEYLRRKEAERKRLNPLHTILPSSLKNIANVSHQL